MNIPAVRNGLVQRFGGRVPHLDNGDRIIAEGAAWIAHDRLRLSLAKPIELLQPDGTYVEIVEEDHALPLENQTLPILASQFYCVDPRDGVANFQFVRPVVVGYGARSAPRQTYTVLSLKIDPYVPPFVERLNVSIQIDHDYIVHLDGHSSGRNDHAMRKIHDLEFALTLPAADEDKSIKKSGTGKKGKGGGNDPIVVAKQIGGGVQLRSNVSTDLGGWRSVPGDIVERWRPGWFDTRADNATAQQRDERYYYSSCSVCGKRSYEISLEGCDLCKALPKSINPQR